MLVECRQPTRSFYLSTGASWCYIAWNRYVPVDVAKGRSPFLTGNIKPTRGDHGADRDLNG
ncbi:hypothetical protein BDR03DRAFT_941252 [Suillus americanus]|nr:hypothetical protein BDR03DRAFT_941252 [Suillus americanus]